MTSNRKCVLIVLFLLGLSTIPAFGQDVLEEYNPLIEAGQYTKVQAKMRKAIADNPGMNPTDRLVLEFEIERLDRIRKDFTKTKEDVLEYIRTYVPDVTDENIRKWEEEKSLEYKTIDGKKWYFYRAVPNLFRINRELKAIKKAYEEKHGQVENPEYSFIQDAKQIVQAAATLNKSLVKPRRFNMTYTLTVDADAVPGGEVIRAWLPYPREGNPRQVDIQFFDSDPREHIISENDAYLQRSIYLEKKAVPGKPTVFQVRFAFKTYSQYQPIDPKSIQPYDTDSDWYKTYTSEKPPHVVFTPELKKVSQEIVGNETNPYLKAKKIFQWIDEWSPWAGAREYSTMRNIPMYVYENKHGDCGMQALMFLTMARLNGIPTHWQSGWWLPPGAVNLHDWCEIYLEPYGWLLVDQDLGIQDSDDERVKWFCLGNTNAYRWVVNDDFSKPFYPAKIHSRSETVDFQRGEVEWRGGNLYFDQWDYHLNVEIVE